MKYKVTISKCEDRNRATAIAQRIAAWSGADANAVLTALTSKSVCVRLQADEGEAMSLKQMFEGVGAQVELEPINTPVRKDDDDDEDDGPKRTPLTEQEFAAKLASRPELFKGEQDSRIKIILPVCMILGALLSVRMMTLRIVDAGADFYEKLPEERIASIMAAVPTTLEEKKKEDEKKKKPDEEIKSEKKKLNPTKSKGAGGTTGGGGDPRARVTKKGVLGIISGQVKGKYVASADVFGKGGFATGIDAVIAGVGGLQSGGGSGVGRKGVAGIGYGAGYGSGFGGGAGGVDDLIGSLMSGDEGGSGIQLKKKANLQITEPSFTKGGALTGGRSKASIMRVVMQNLAALRYEYNKRLREKPGLQGKITVKFAIDEFGKVIFCQVVDSNMGDQMLEEKVMEKIRRWVFDKIDKPGDITEVVYPFVFSQ